MVNQKIVMVPYEDSLKIAYDAKILSLRWDLIPWSLVLDIDYKNAFEQDDPSVGRAWLVFDDITDVWCCFDEARIPNGIFSTYGIITSEPGEEYTNFSLSVLAPKFGIEKKLTSNPHQTLKIRAKKLRSAKSKEVGVFGEFGPCFVQRQNLGSDQEFLSILRENNSNV